MFLLRPISSRLHRSISACTFHNPMQPATTAIHIFMMKIKHSLLGH